MADNATSAAILGAVLGPVAALVGSKLKDLLEMRDARKRVEQLTGEATALLAFSDTLQKSAEAGGAVAAVPSESMQLLQATVAKKIGAAIAAASESPAPPQHALARDILDRVFLLHQPLRWWGWMLHAVYYVFAGMLALVAGLVVHDYASNSADREGGVVLAIFFAVVTLAINLVSNAVDRHALAKVTLSPQP
jgi:cell wall-associated NlpC family hydrolase